MGSRSSSHLLPFSPDTNASFTDYVVQMWSRKFHYYGCIVTKCGSESWFALMYETHLPSIEYNKDNKNNIRWRSFFDYPMNGLFQRRLQSETLAAKVLNDPSYFKFAVVRHPWNRLVSGFKDKFIDACRRNRTCFSQRFTPGLDRSLSTEVTLTEFLLALIHSRSPINKHFLPSSRTCDTTHVPYDFIGDLENPEHIAFILDRIKAPHNLEHDHRTSKPAYVARVSSAPVHCDRTTVDLAAVMYKEDLEAYGYTMDAAYAACETYGLTHAPK